MRRGGANGDRWRACRCGTSAGRRSLSGWAKSLSRATPRPGSTRIDSHSPTHEELALIEEARAHRSLLGTPTVPFGPDREMWRAAHRAMGITDVAGFFTKRNLHALAALRHAIVGAAEGRVREALLFAFTAAVNRASRRYQWNAQAPDKCDDRYALHFIAALRVERLESVPSQGSRRTALLPQLSRAQRLRRGVPTIGDRSRLPARPVGRHGVMDPPFGSNIFYADSSLLWEAWLGELTDQDAEIVVNKHRAPADGGKSGRGLWRSDAPFLRPCCASSQTRRPGDACLLQFRRSGLGSDPERPQGRRLRDREACMCSTRASHPSRA